MCAPVLFAFLASTLLTPNATAVERGAAEEVAVAETEYGRIVWRFFSDQAPGHVAYVKELIRRGFYDGTLFHRVIPHFVIQGGDPLSKNDDRSDDGNGEADRRLRAEFSQTLHYRPGTVGMARDVDPDSGSCQFFIALEDLPRLDGKYTIFGEVIAGLDVARTIASQPRDLNDNPLRAIPTRIHLERQELTAALYSLAPGTSGEVLSGPSKPRFFDAHNVLWALPKPHIPTAASGTHTDARVELAIDAEGHVLDVRFVQIDVPDAARLRDRLLQWVFDPARYDGVPAKARFEMNADGTGIGPSTAAGAPREVGGSVAAPRPCIRVALASSQKPPAKTAKMRLTIDPSGTVTDVALQSSCGDAALDEEAIKAAHDLAFSPAMMTEGSKPAEPVAVYLDLDACYVAAPAK